MKQISGISDVIEAYDHFIIDMWGVVYDGVRLVDNAVQTLQAIQDAGKKYIFVSNTPRMPEFLERVFVAENVSPHLYDNILFTAGGSTRKSLEKRLSEPCYVMEGHEAGGLLDGITLNRVSDVSGAHFILNSIATGHEGYMDYFSEVMKKGLAKNLEMVCANPDLEVMHNGEIYTCAGHYAQMYEDAGGKVEWNGKPYTPIYDWGVETLGNPDKSKICMIGDSLRTDITGAKNFGIDSIWNLDGTTRHLTLEEAEQRASEKELSPTYIMRGFEW